MNPFLRNMALAVVACLLGMDAICQPPSTGPAPSTKHYAGLTAQRAMARGWTVVEGDIVQDKATTALTAASPRPAFLTVASQSSLWPPVDGVATVYYVNANAGAMDPTDEMANANIQTAINQFNADFSGVIQWVQWTSSDGPNYVLIDLSADNTSGECEAAEGYEAEAEQPMDGSAYCTVGTILHEMGHVIGLYHEFQRADAANYVTVNYNNVIKGSWGNFETLTENAQILGPYDYASVMQYPPYSFSRNGGPVIETIPAGMPLGSAEGVPVPAFADYSAGDKEAIERLYGAPPTKVTVTSNPVGLQVVVDGANVITPQTYTWALNSTHTLDVATGVQTLTGDIEDSTTSATFYYMYGRWNDDGAQSHKITVAPGDGSTGFPATGPQVATYSANFIQLVPYTTAIYPASTGTVSSTPGAKPYSGITGDFFIARQEVTLTARPVAGWSFYEFNNGPFWLPGGLGANPKSFYVPDTGNPVDTTAEFSNLPVYKVDITPETFSSNLSVSVDGGFAYTPVNFSHYYDYEGQTTPTWTAGSSHTLNYNHGSPELPYSVNSRYAFTSWSDQGAASHTISSLPATSTSYIATVTPQFAPATNFSYPPCGGTGALTPASPTGDGFYPHGQLLTYSATAGTGWTFAGWTFDLTGTATPAKLTAIDETLVFANFNIASAPLTLTSTNPASADKGGGGFTLTLNGTGFSPDSVVAVNGAYPSVTYKSAQELQVPITAAQIATAGPFPVYVENFPPDSTGCAVFGYQTFDVHDSSLASITTLVSSGNWSVVGTAVTFTASVASAENNATGRVTFKEGSTVLGYGTLNSSAQTTYTTTSLAAGAQQITAVYGGDGNNLGSTSTAVTQTVSATGSTLTSPTPGSTFTGASATFTWTATTGATSYELVLGTTGPGSGNLGNSGSTTATSFTFSKLTTNGGTINARLYTTVSGIEYHADYTYTAATIAVLTSPAPGSLLAGPKATFEWKGAAGATSYELWIGSTGVGSDNLFSSGSITTTTSTFAALPTNGETVYVRLFTMLNGFSLSNDYTYTAAEQAAMISPVPSSTLTSSSETFTWSAGTGASAYEIWVGSTGVGSNNLDNSGSITATSEMFSNLPTNGEKIYVRLFTTLNGTMVSADYTYTSTTSP